MNRICDCEDWKPNVDKINSFISFGVTHSFIYDGKMFQYCPWCGKKLIEQESD